VPALSDGSAAVASAAKNNGQRSLLDELGRLRVVVFVGSGGVGKTTAAAAYALRAAIQGKRVLCLTVDPARRLADSLGIQMGEEHEQLVPDELFGRYGLQCAGSLTAVMLDRKRTFDNLVVKYASSAEHRERILGNKLYQYVSTALAGTQEYTALEKLLLAYQDDRYDLVVLDTPPTGNALDFLAAPMKLVNAIDSPVPRWFVRMLGGERPLGIAGRSAAYILRGLSRFTGAGLLNQVAEFVSDINHLFGGFRSRATEVYSVLRGGDVAFVAVAAPFVQSLADAVFFGRKLEGFRMKLRAVVVNRVHPDPLIPEQEDRQLGPIIRDALPAGRDPADLVRRMRRAAEEVRAVSRAERASIELLRKQIGPDIFYTEIPAFDREIHDLGALAELSDHL
jgi:anion-transporting  ArsA/GET3 family ATPase